MAEHPHRPRRPTVLDVAAIAHVSRATVGRYVNGQGYISVAAREAVAKAIEEVGFVPSIAARNLVSQRTRMIALIVHEPDVVFVEDPNIGSILLGANSALSESGYLMATIVVDSEVDVARVVEYLAGGFVDGAIVVSARVEDPVTRAIEQFAVPAVFIGSMPSLPNATSVGIDNVEASREITTRLLATGRSKVGMIAAALDRTSGADRLTGFVAALGDSFTDALVAPVDLYTYAAGRAGMQELLSREPLIDGVVAASDAVAAGAMSVLREHGRRVPEDVGVVGFDDSAWALRCDPPLSTVHQPAYELGRAAGELVLRLIDGDLIDEGTVVKTSVVWRDSA